MLRFVCMMMGVLLAFPAQARDIEAIYTQWERLRSPDVSDIGFSEGVRFMAEHPGWPEEKIIRLRTEAAALREKPPREVMAKFCTDVEPISGRGMIACGAAQASTSKAQEAWLKQGWLQGDFNENEEENILQAFGSKLTSQDHIARMERLLYEGRSKPAKRIMRFVPASKQKLYQVRIAFVDNEKKAPSLLKSLSAAEQHDGGILFERVRWRIKRNDDDIVSLILAAPKNTPYADQWWPLRATAARNAIMRKNYRQALALIADHGSIKAESLAEALFLKGWIRLRHKNDAANAYKDFFELYSSVYTPVSKARAAYWAARAAAKNGNAEIEKEWLEKAARYPTVFYGQLAHLKLHPTSPIKLPEPAAPSAEEKKQFEQLELVQATRALARGGNEKMRDLFLSTLAMQATTEKQFVLLAGLAHDLNGIAAGVEVAKLALRNNSLLVSAGWPKIALPSGLPIEPALTLAITRQESEFNPTARSTANARGLMQLLPSTAKQMAKKLDMPYRDSMLENPAANLTLGSNYLGRMIEGFDGSYILGIASYNAGPRNVRKWIAAHGMPPKNALAAIDWIESIPFGETRNYVMRVIENLSVYRTLEHADTPLMIESDLLR